MFAGFNNKKRSSISNGDWDRDGVKNMKDCSPFDHKKQDKCPRCGENYSKYDMTKVNGVMYCEGCAKDEFLEKKMGQVSKW